MMTKIMAIFGSPKREYNEYDLLKVFTMILVVIGHFTIRIDVGHFNGNITGMQQQVYAMITFAIYLFHMPLFMSISGAVFKIGKSGGYERGNIKQFALSKIRRLIIPYLFVGFCFLIPLEILFSEETFYDGDIFNRVGELLTGRNTRHLWFLISLFEIFIIHYFVEKLTNNSWAVLSVSIVVAVITSTMDINCAVLTQCIMYYPYFVLGGIMFNLTGVSEKRLLKVCLLGILVCPIVIYVQSIVVIDVFFSIIWSLFMIPVFFYLAKLCLPHLNLNSSFFDILIKSSFCVYLFHISVLDLMFYYFSLEENHLYAFSLVTTTLAIIIPIILFFSIKYLGAEFLIGEKRLKRSSCANA